MKLIAHRGLTQGPNKQIENDPKQILDAINQGYDCEIDLWIVNSELWLGHDNPQYLIKEDFLKNNNLSLWIHAKNLAALRWLTSTTIYKYFWHQNDDFVLTSNNFIWTFPGKELTSISISVLPEWHDLEFKDLNTNCYGICSDYVEKIKKIVNG
jgi:hypothetical protein